MKTIILCGGLGTRLREETEFKPKPLVMVGPRPILWHIMKIYAHYGYHEFVLALGYKGEMIKEYFLYERAISNDFTIDTVNGEISYHTKLNDGFIITFTETGLDSLTGERILRAKPYITEDEFMVTYGDGVADINIEQLVSFHRKQGTLGTVTAVHPYSKYGLLLFDKETGLAKSFVQKPLMGECVNGGFMIFRREVFEYFDKGDMESVFPRLIEQNQLSVYMHERFFKSMDTHREMQELNEIWKKDRPWAVWEK
ncbi:MAG: sugar phosphate nucleotidyltransferase [Patescibacteria group bacterium]